jgi:acetolactate synthase regulatory subunit
MIRQLALETTGRPDALIRILTVLRRRGCRVTAIHFREADRHAPERLEVTVETPARVDHCIEHWLAALVDVLDVREAGAHRELALSG